MSNQNNDKVLIVGAGIGGLALAQGLRKHNIPFEVFERDEGVRSRKQGWAIALVECLPHLDELLPSDLGDVYETSVNAGLDEADHLGVIDITTGQLVAMLGTDDKKSKDRFLRAGRESFRNFLWNKIPVSTGKQFSHYSEDAEGVTVYFKDGSSARGSALVGADGASSHVRSQLLGSGPELSSFIPIAGECTLTRAQYNSMTAMGNAGFISGNAEVRVAVGRRSIAPDGETADYFFALCIHSENPKRDAAWAHSATKQELFDKCMEVAPKLPDNVKYIITLAGAEGIVTPVIRFLEFVPPLAMPTGRVTLLGDAAHAMVPFKGAGANTAVEDACDLARLIVQRQYDGREQEWADLVSEYNGIMVERGQKLVLGSRRAGTQDNAKAVVEGRVHSPLALVNREAAVTA